MIDDAILTVERLTKRFPGVTALDDVSLSIRRGACQALVGENGAGKSTLGRTIAGVHAPDKGVMRLDGRPVRFSSPQDAMRAGIGLVHQELAFCPNLSVAENLLLGQLPRRGVRIDWPVLRRTAAETLKHVGVDLDVDQPLGNLTIGQEQLVQIAAAMRVGGRLLVLDEPTSSLSQHEAERLFALMAELRGRGVTLIYVSHRMNEIFQHCDMISVLRDGRHVTTLRTADATPDEIVRHMIGRAVAGHAPAHIAKPRGECALRVSGLMSPGKFRDIRLQLHRGEIVGLAGLVGAGRTEVAQAMFGMDPQAVGEMTIGATRGIPGRPREAMSRGLAYLPEDRKRQGLVLPMSGRKNLSLAILPRLAIGPILRHARERRLVTGFFERLRVRAPDIDTPVDGLSGGNQQKIALAKWLAAECPVLLVDEPTRGVDVGAKAEIHALLDELAVSGIAILLISSELPELLGLSSRIIVLREGRMVGEMARTDATEDRLMRLMAGVEMPGRTEAASSTLK